MSRLDVLLGQDIDEHVRSITNELPEYGIERDELSELDHLCYRVETLERYKEMKQLLASAAILCGETTVQG